MSNLTVDIGRRNILKAAGIAAGSTIISGSLASSTMAQSLGSKQWNSGDVKHIIPTANADRFLIKVSFHHRQEKQPYLSISNRKVPGKQSDPIGRFWQFDVTDLKPDTEYNLKLIDSNGSSYVTHGHLRPSPLKV